MNTLTPGKRIGLRARLSPARQRGLTLIIALLVLIAMTLAGVALMRSVDSATLIAGNLAFRQSATASGEAGIQAAVDDMPTDLTADSSTNGYFASIPSPDDDFTGNGGGSNAFDWSSAKSLPLDSAGNAVSYVVQRLCTSAGALDAAKCRLTKVVNNVVNTNSAGLLQDVKNYRDVRADPSKGAGSGGGSTSAYLTLGLYRITVRVQGPRNTFSYLQAIVAVAAT
jgi:type IV pilus assembly protein PilX